MWVLDTSSLIAMKRVPIADQWAVFRVMETMVERGEVAVSHHVVKEVSDIAFPDVPGAWASGIKSKICHPPEADYAVLTEVMSFAGNVVEPDAPGDPADPYVLALALQLKRLGQAVTVVTEDVVDRLPLKISLRSGCELLGLTWCGCDEFLATIRTSLAVRTVDRGDDLPLDD